jgi:hypothetical protein
LLRPKRSSVGIFTGAVLLTVSYAQPLHQVQTMDFPSFKVLPGETDADGLPTSGAKLCLLKPSEACFQMPSSKAEASDSVVYEFGLDPVSQRLPLPRGGSLVFFSAQFSGGGSGTLDSLAILRYELHGNIVNLMPFVGVTNQSDRAVWQIASVSNFPILATADFYWTDGETHFSDHKYQNTVAWRQFDHTSEPKLKTWVEGPAGLGGRYFFTV